MIDKLYLTLGMSIFLIGGLSKDQEVTDIWPVWELLNIYINVFFRVV